MSSLMFHTASNWTEGTAEIRQPGASYQRPMSPRSPAEGRLCLGSPTDLQSVGRRGNRLTRPQTDLLFADPSLPSFREAAQEPTQTTTGLKVQ